MWLTRRELFAPNDTWKINSDGVPVPREILAMKANGSIVLLAWTYAIASAAAADRPREVRGRVVDERGRGGKLLERQRAAS